MMESAKSELHGDPALRNGRQPVPIRSFKNTEIGDCTIAKQAVASTRFERLEQRTTLLEEVPLVEVWHEEY